MHALFLECIELVDYESLVHGEKMQLELEDCKVALDVVLHENAVEHDEKVEIIIHIVATVGTNDKLDTHEIDVMVELDDIENDIEFFHDEIAFDDEVDEDEVLEDSEMDELDDHELLDEVHQMHGHIVEQMVDVDEILDCGELDEAVEKVEHEIHQVGDEDDELVDVDMFDELDENDELLEILPHEVVQDDDMVEIEVVE